MGNAKACKSYRTTRRPAYTPDLLLRRFQIHAENVRVTRILLRPWKTDELGVRAEVRNGARLEIEVLLPDGQSRTHYGDDNNVKRWDGIVSAYAKEGKS